MQFLFRIKEYENLKDFRSRILEMDDEIKQLKNFERVKQLSQQKNDYQVFLLKYWGKYKLLYII